MTSRRKKDRALKRFPFGERCDECRARRWYIESGFKYCENGHRIEGYVEQDIDEDDNFGQLGKVTRKKQEVKEKTTRHLSGNAARELFLECLQLVLRKQIVWLVNEKKLPPELETIIRDLWDLRIRNFTGLRSVNDTEPGSASESGGTGTDGEFFSSQSDSDVSGTSRTTTTSRARSWTSEPGQNWNLPGLVHCLALCYLGCLSLRLPVRIGDIYNWAKTDQILFLEATDKLPKEMTDRLPGSYNRALMVRHAPFQGGELHQAVLELVLEYHLNYAINFPELNTPLLLLHYLRELALPAEIYVHVRSMTKMLGLDFVFNMDRKRFKLLDHPDILLISCVVFSTKLIYPFDETERRPTNPRDPTCLQMDWKKWRALMREEINSDLHRRDINSLQPDDAWTMSDTKIDDYLEWYQATRIQVEEDTQELRELFPLAEKRPPISRQGLTVDQIDERLQTAQSYIRTVAPRQDGFFVRSGEDHEVYRSFDDMPDTAKAFYGKAADLSGLSVGKLVKAVQGLETMIERWSTREIKAAEAQASD